jgi:hypothetical protein
MKARRRRPPTPQHAWTAGRTDADDGGGANGCADPRMAVTERDAIDRRIRLQIISAGFAVHAFRITHPPKLRRQIDHLVVADGGGHGLPQLAKRGLQFKQLDPRYPYLVVQLIRGVVALLGPRLAERLALRDASAALVRGCIWPLRLVALRMRRQRFSPFPLNDFHCRFDYPLVAVVERFVGHPHIQVDR